MSQIRPPSNLLYLFMKFLLPALLILLFSCSNDPATNTKSSSSTKIDSTSKALKEANPNVAFEVINQSDNSSNLKYDIYIKDTSKIKILNDYLINRYNPDKKLFLNINYFDNRKVAKTYFEKQFSESVSEGQKDKLFRNYIASYKYNPATGYDQLSFMHN